MHQSKAVKALVAALFMAGLFYGCSKKETPTSTTIHDTITVYDTTVFHDTTTVNVSTMALCWINDYYGQVILVSDPTADTSQSNATFSWGGSKTSRIFQSKYVWTGYIGFEWDPDSTWGYSHQFMDTVLTVAITSNVGNCQGSMALPDSTHINTPSVYDTLPIGSVTCTWAAAARAEWYQVYYHAYACSSSYAIGWLDSKETFTSDTSMIIPASYFNYPGAQYYYVWISAYPRRGPKPQAGSTGNMTGTIKGFLVRGGRSHGTNFYVGTPPKGLKTPKMEHKAPSRQERMNKYLEAVTGQ